MPRIVIHIGPPKTGTTALQASLHSSRAQLYEHGVSYLPKTTQASIAAMALTQRTDPSTGIRVPDREWRQFAARIMDNNSKTIVISSEWFAAASKDHIARLQRTFKSRDVQIILTIRAIATILPSRWRQNVLEGATYTYAEWLAKVFDDRSSDLSKRFWYQHRHDLLAQRWSQAFGGNNVHVVVVREDQPSFALEAVEDILSIPKGTLNRNAVGANVSASDIIVEAVRLFNGNRERYGISRALGYTAVTRGALMQLPNQPGPGLFADRVLAPYLGFVEREAKQVVEGLRSLGLPVHGSLSDLLEVKVAATRTTEGMSEASVVEMIAGLMTGELRALGLTARNNDSGDSSPNGRPDGLDDVTVHGRHRRVAMLGHAIVAARLSVSEVLWLCLHLLAHLGEKFNRGLSRIVKVK